MAPDSTHRERIPLRRLSVGRKRALIVAARIEFALATLSAVAVCAARFTVFIHDSGPAWAILGAVIAPAYLMATGLAVAHAHSVGRPFPALAPELAFWAVAPVATAALLAVT